MTPLATRGFHVFAGVRREENSRPVRSGANANVTPLVMDNVGSIGGLFALPIQGAYNSLQAAAVS